MFDVELNITDKILIIKHSNLSDAEILSSNYKELAGSTDNPDEQKKFIILRSNAQKRIKELTSE